MRKIFSIAVTLMLFFTVPALILGQGATTGSFSGSIVDADNNPLAGVFVEIVHTPTGTKYKTISRSNGVFNIPSVRVGGPYTITASFEGFRTEKQEGLVVKLGETKHVGFKMQLATVDAGEVVVTASTPVINPYRTGASQNVSEDAIENLPTITRSLSDFTRMSPQMVSGEAEGSFAAGGRSSRYNNIQIDGAQNNDLFGLGSSGTPGGQAETSAISIDAVQEFQIVLAPYDVRQGMFTGGGVNIITKSGTNKFSGSAYFEGRNENFVGKGPSGIDFNDFSEGTYGATLGGPLVKNKLFFFFSAEGSNQKVPEYYHITGTGAEDDFGYKAEADRFDAALQGYGYDSGGYGKIANERKRLNLFGRLDWNINDKHRLTLRHQFSSSDKDSLYRDSDRSFTFGNGGVIYKNDTNSTVLQLNSTLGENIHNELIVNYSTIRDLPTYMGELFPNISVSLGGGKTFYAGSDQYRHKNQLDQDLIEITNTLTIFKGNHTFVLGTHNEFFKFYNVYVQRANGKYEFSSLEDFENGVPYRYDRYYSLSSDPNAPAEFSVNQIGFYAGDEWQVTKTLKLTLGIRADVPLMPDDPPNNPIVFETFGIPTNHNAGGNVLWSPRLGFNLDVNGDQDLQIRGGIGIFSGRTPYVWISNQYSNTGADLGRYYTKYPGFFITDPLNQPENPIDEVTGDINLIDESYKFPQVLKTNIAIDKKLPLGFTGTLEFVYSKSINEIKYQNINIAPTGETSWDGRPLFGDPSTSGSTRYGDPDYINSNFQDVLLLTNTNEGYQYSLSFQLQKEWADGSFFNASYTYGMSKDLFAGTSSRAISNWKYNIHTGNPNEPTLGYSAHDTRHRIMLAIAKTFRFIPNAPTTFSLFYNGRSGHPYNTRYYNDVNGDGQTNDSIYVPASADEIILTKGSWEDLDAYISGDPGLDKNRGKILPAFSSRDPWYHRVDVKVSQSIPIPGLKGHKLTVFASIENLLNMFDKDSGVYRYIEYDEAPLTYVGMDDASGKPMFEYWGERKDQETNARFNINQILSRWRALFGIKYRF